MNIPTKRLANGFELPVYGMGTWKMGGDKYSVNTTNDSQDIEALQMAMQLGVTHFDTAEVYGVGHSEELLGQAINGIDRRKLTIATKVPGEHQGYDGVLRAVAGSLKRLGTDYVDLYMLHSFPDPGISLQDTMKALDELIAQGIVKNIGVSNLSPRRFAEAQKYSINPLVCNQLHYNVQYREVEVSGALNHCQTNDVFLVAWRPIQKGSLPIPPIIRDLATKYEKTPTQIALNWLVSQQNVVTIAKTSNVNHLKENLGALDWQMSPEDVEKIRQDFPDQQPISDTYPLDYPGDIPAY